MYTAWDLVHGFLKVALWRDGSKRDVESIWLPPSAGGSHVPILKQGNYPKPQGILEGAELLRNCILRHSIRMLTCIRLGDVWASVCVKRLNHDHAPNCVCWKPLWPLHVRVWGTEPVPPTWKHHFMHKALQSPYPSTCVQFAQSCLWWYRCRHARCVTRRSSTVTSAFAI